MSSISSKLMSRYHFDFHTSNCHWNERCQSLWIHLSSFFSSHICIHFHGILNITLQSKQHKLLFKSAIQSQDSDLFRICDRAFRTLTYKNSHSTEKVSDVFLSKSWKIKRFLLYQVFSWLQKENKRVIMDLYRSPDYHWNMKMCTS